MTNDITPAPVPNPVPVWTIGWNTPGYLPDPDSVYARHIRVFSDRHFADDITEVCDYLTGRMIEDLEESADECRIDRDEYPADYDEGSDPGAGDDGMAESLHRHVDGRTGEAYEDIRHGIARAVKSGETYTYTLNLGNGRTVAYWVTPATDGDPVPVCTEYADEGRCELDVCGPATTLVIDPSTVEHGALYVQSTPAGPVGYRVTIDRDECGGSESPREWSNVSLWSGADTDRFSGFDETPGDMFGRHGSAADVWEDLRNRLSSDGAAYEAFRLLCRVYGYACAPLSRAYDGTVSAGDPGIATRTVRTRSGRIFDDIHGHVDGVAVIDPNEATSNNALTGGEWLPVTGEPAPGSPLAPEYDPVKVHGTVAGECAAYNQWAEGDVYRYTVERVDVDTDGEWNRFHPGDHVGSCGGYLGSDHVASGLAHAVADEIETASAVYECTYCAHYGGRFLSADRDEVIRHAGEHPIRDARDMVARVTSD